MRLILLIGLMLLGGMAMSGESALVSKLTSVLPVAQIEPTAEFFRSVGFEVTMRVPDEGPMGFAGMSNGKVEIMLQTFDSIYEDNEAFRFVSDKAPSVLFVEVSDFTAVEKAMQDFEVLMPRRETFYGATEITVREPGGHVVTFAWFKPAD
jgi:uncharacterized glyoxalase superfamily protein PhnB